MTTLADSPPTYRPTTRSTERTVLLWVGVAFAIAGAVIAIAGGALLAVFGSDGRVSSGPQALTTATTALVTEEATIDDAAGVARVLGDTSIRVSAEARGEHGVFVGIARSADVDRFLAGAPVDEITDFDVDPFRLTRDRRAGSATPAPPAEQSFWVAQSGGPRAADVRWTVRDGDYRLVVMNADGTPRVDSRADFAVTVPKIADLGWSIVGGGLLVLVGGLAAIAVGVRRKG